MNKLFTNTKITNVYLALMTTLFLLAFGSSGYTNISRVKSIIFFLLTCIYIVCIAVSSIITSKKDGVSSVFSVSKTQRTVYIFAALYALFTLISAFLSEYFPITFIGASRYEGAVTICLYCIILFLVSQFAKPSKTLFCIFAASVTLFDIVCLLQLAGLNPFHLYPEGMNYYAAGVLYSGAYIGTIGNAGFSAAFLAATLPLFAFVAAQRKFPTCIFAIPPFLLSAIILIKCNILASLLGLAAAIIAAVPVFLLFSKRKLILYLGALLALIFIILSLLYFIDFGGELPHEIHMILHGDVNNKFGSSRIEIWRNVLGAIHEAPILGKGPDTMIYEDFEPFSNYYPSLDKTLVRKIDTAHNEYLNILYHQGILGLLSYLGILISVLAAFIKKYRTCKMTAILGICALCYAVQAFFGISVFMSATFFWICLGFICSEKKE